MSISEPFIRRPIATSLLMLGVLVFGIGAYNLLPVAAVPQVDFPTITVTAQYPGADPKTMASSVATPLETQFTAIPALAQMTSWSGVGVSSITLQFDLSRNIDAAASDVQQAINAASGVLPPMPTPPTYKKVNPADFPILIYAIHSDAVPRYKVDDYANNVIADTLSMQPGVGQVSVFGSMAYAARVQVNPPALAAKGIGFEDIRSALVNATVNNPKGSIETEHQSIALDTNDQLFDAAQFGNIIAAYKNGAPVRIKDVGDVVNGVQNARLNSWYGDQRSEGIAIQKAPTANTIAVVDEVRALMPKLEQSLPPSVHVDLMSDRSETIRASVHDVQFTMILTITLVIIVIFLFLRTLWATVIPSLAVPLSLLATFGVLYVGGYSVDNISLMGLTISVGFIVDDAIVMIENVVRYIEEGMGPFEAALKGAGQIGFTIISITFSLIAVFIPLFAMGGIIGRLFREFAVTVAVSVTASALISLTLTPVMCSLFLKQEGHDAPKGRFNRGSERVFRAALNGYDRGLIFIFRHQRAALIATLLLMVATGYLYTVIPKGFFPQQDTGFIFGECDVREDSSVAGVDQIRGQIVKIVMQEPGVQGVFSYDGATPYNPAENTARIFWGLKPYSERNLTADQIIQDLRQKVSAVRGAKFFMQVPQNITVGGRLSRTQYQYTLTDTNGEELNHWAPILQQALQKLPELQDVASDQQIAAAHLALDIDRDAASRLGLSVNLIDQTLYDAFGQRQVATIYTTTNQYKVILEVQPQYLSDPNVLTQIYAAGPNGAQIPLSSFAHFTHKAEPLIINHQGIFPAVTLSFNLAPGVALGQAVDSIQTLTERLHVPGTLNTSFQGTAQAFQASLSSMPLLVAAAILVVYIVLGILYESYIHPLTILSALPSAGVGALLMLMLMHYELSVIAIVGIILLIGIVKKNAIMMIDFALQAERHEGKSPQEAIHQACLLRFRPIMMTTFAALFGAVPIAFGGGGGSELRQPLGVAIIGGLLISQWLTLYTTPVIYLYLDRLSGLLGRRSQRQSRLARALDGTSPATAEDTHGAE